MLFLAAIIGLVGLLLFVAVLFGVREHLRGIDDRLRSDAVDREAVQQKLEEVHRLLEDAQPKLALIEADKLLHFVVKELVYEGQPLEAHVEAVRAYEARLEGVPELSAYVQRLRTGGEGPVSLERAREGIALYKKSLKQLGVL